MPGTAKQLIDLIIAQRAKGNPAVAHSVRTKLVLKGINPDSYSATTPDDPAVIERLEVLARELGIKKISIKGRLWLLILLFVVGIVLVRAVDFQMDQLITRNVIFPSLGDQVLERHKNAVKVAVEIQASSLAEKLKDLGTREEQVDLLIKETDPIRFFGDRSGYFFAYDLNGVRINVPIDKSQNGHNLLLLVDGHGNRFVEDMVKTAKNGDGFVQYWFKKPDMSVHPKLSYVKKIPGTDFIIGAGTYIDNVEFENTVLQDSIDAGKSSYSIYKTSALLFILVSIVVMSLMIYRSIARYIGPIARL